MPIHVGYISALPALPVTGAFISIYERFALLKRDFGVEGTVLSLAPAAQQKSLLSQCENLNLKVIRTEPEVEFQWRDSIRGSFIFGAALGRSNIAAQAEVDSAFDRALSEHPFDVILANARDFASLLYLARRGYRRTIMVVTEDEFPRQSEFGEATELKAAFGQMPRVAVASEFLRASLKEIWNIDARLLHNAIDFDFYRGEAAQSASDSILCMHPYMKKGVHLFMALASAMPHRRFALASGFGPEYRALKPQLSALENVTQLPFDFDARRMYGKARTVIVPSVWQEAFSRVVVEALACGKPVIASRVGGIPEAGGDAALYVTKPEPELTPDNIRDWRAAIELLDDQATYVGQVEKGYAQVEILKRRVQMSIGEWHSWLMEVAGQ